MRVEQENCENRFGCGHDELCIPFAPLCRLTVLCKTNGMTRMNSDMSE